MATRGFGSILQHIEISHCNLFTTQQFATQLAQLSNIVADFCRLGHASDVVRAQSDIKDMYSEILHTAISSSVHYIRDKWLADHRHGSLCINKSGRRGVCLGKARDSYVAVTMSVDTIVAIVLYELKNAFFHVGKAHACVATSHWS
jgi:hypothetical protein